MTSSRSKDNMVIFECDDCGDQIGDEFTEFDEAWKSAKAQGWTFGEGTHHCADCSHEFLAEGGWG